MTKDSRQTRQKWTMSHTGGHMSTTKIIEESKETTELIIESHRNIDW